MLTAADITEAVKLGDACPDELLAKLRAAPLLQVCKDMQLLLTDEASVAPAMRTLARAAVGRQELTAAQISLLGSFFSEKASKPQLAEAAAACLKMVIDDGATWETHAAEVLALVLDTFLPAIRVQDRTIGVRRTCFGILRAVLTQRAVADPAVCTVKRLHAVFEALDGEGDPQLVAAMFDLCADLFEWAPSCALKDVAENYFEGLSSYFPVMFTQPAGCPVTKRDLQKGLALCLSHPALSEHCIPFLLGKLVSPSTVVKLDVVHVIKKCVDRYPVVAFLDAYGADVVTHLRNEVVKLSAFPDIGGGAASAASPTNVIAACCGVLTDVARLCAQSEHTKIMQLFEPVSEGTVQAASGDSARHTCSAYATMLYSTLIGSWGVCMALGGYMFSMLTLVAHDSVEQKAGSETVNTLMLLSALCAAFVDAMSARTKDSTDEEETDAGRSQLQAALSKALPPFLSALRATSDTLALGSGSAEDAPSEEADILTMCRGELVCAALKLDLCLTPWMAEDDVDRLVAALVRAAAFRRSAYVRAKMSRLLFGYTSLDPENRTQQAVREVAQSGQLDAHLDALVELVMTLSEASQDFAMFALQDLLLPPREAATAPESVPLRSLDLTARYAAVTRILGHFADLDDAVAAALLERFLAQPPSPAMLESIRAIFAKATSAFRSEAYARETGEQRSDCLLKAAIVSCGPELVPHLGTASVEEVSGLLRAFASLLKEWGPAEGAMSWRAVAMNGIASTVCCSSAPVGTYAHLDASAAFQISALWGHCMRKASDEEARSRSAPNDVAAGARVVKAVLLSAGSTDTEKLEAFAFFPLLAATSEVRPHRSSLLTLYLAAAAERGTTQAPLFWKGLFLLLEGEDAPHICSCEDDLLRLMSSLQPDSCVGGELIRAVFFILDRKGAAASLHTAIFASPTLLSVVCDGLSSPSMTDRCAALEYLSSAAAVVAEKSKVDAHAPTDPVQRRLLQQARDVILHKTVPCLTDRKRLVRQAAGRCRNSWYRVK